MPSDRKPVHRQRSIDGLLLVVTLCSLTLLLSCLTYATPVLADPSGMDVSTDAANNMNIETETHTVKILSDRPEIEYSVFGGSVAKFTCTLSDLVEFVDRDGSGQLENGEITRTLDLKDLSWQFMYEVQSPPENTSKGNNTYVKSIYRFQNATYDMLLVLKVYESPVTMTVNMAGKNIAYIVAGDAREVKFDIAVRKWPWSSEKAKLALRMSVSANPILNVSNPGELSEHERGISFQTGGQSVVVKWIKEVRIKPQGAEAENIGMVTVRRNLVDERSLEVDFVYPNFMGGSLVHDPSVALGAIWIFEPALNMFVVSIGSGVIAIGLVFYIRYRDRRGS